jgi:hypothetical protein
VSPGGDDQRPNRPLTRCREATRRVGRRAGGSGSAVRKEGSRYAKEGEQPPASEVLAALGLPGRRGVSRMAIEEALLAHGAGLLQKELGLDPRVFRLVCVPPDVHLRLGEAEGWGRQPFWTHFDGYLVMADGRLRALAGGDARFGGLYDLVGLSREYDSDRVMARFAVVRRERMVAW